MGPLRRSIARRASIGIDLHGFAARIYPITRSLTGDGVRNTLAEIGRRAHLQIKEVPSGARLFDWTAPKEWNLREAYIADSTGRRIVDVRNHNLHVVSYSTPVHRHMSLAALKPHLHSLPDKPDLIPYRTSYYEEAWGFCLPHTLLSTLAEDLYEVRIDATLAAGSLSYGEYYKAGRSREEVLLSAHVCHPSLANDNCSGLAVLALLAECLGGIETRYSYRVLFAPGTIGAIAWLAGNRDSVERIRHGLIVSNVGDGGGPTYKRSRRGNADIDRAAELVLRDCGLARAQVRPFAPYGYDERQYCSPGFNLPVGSLQRSAWGEFPEYHTSADNLDFIKPGHLESSFHLVAQIIDVIERNATYRNLEPFCEPQLGRRGLYDGPSVSLDVEDYRLSLLWVLNLSDGGSDLIEIAHRSGIPFGSVAEAADRLEEAGLITPVSA